MRVIVTGGAGFIGSAVCRLLVAVLGHDVLNIDKLTYAGNSASLNSINNHPGYRFAKADICDRAAMIDLFEQFQPDGVIHLAAESHVDRSIVDSAAFINTNIVGAFILLETSRAYWLGLDGARRDAFRFLHVSTDEVYGSLGKDGLFSEVTPYDPSSPYSASKAAADHLASAWARTYGFPVVISNCSNNYGPFHFPEKLIPLAILNALHGKPISVYGDGSNVRDWLYVDDHARALFTILTRGRIGEKYNVGVHRVFHAGSERFPELIACHQQPFAKVRSGRVELALFWIRLIAVERALRLSTLYFGFQDRERRNRVIHAPPPDCPAPRRSCPRRPAYRSGC